jgi:hypothetical protein
MDHLLHTACRRPHLVIHADGASVCQTPVCVPTSSAPAGAPRTLASIWRSADLHISPARPGGDWLAPLLETAPQLCG